MYLLKFKRKNDETMSVSIGLASEYKEFSKVTELIRFVHNNALFIESYRIFELVEFEKSCSGDNNIKINSGGNEGTINLTGGASNSSFR